MTLALHATEVLWLLYANSPYTRDGSDVIHVYSIVVTAAMLKVYFSSVKSLMLANQSKHLYGMPITSALAFTFPHFNSLFVDNK